MSNGGWEAIDIISMHEYGEDEIPYYLSVHDAVEDINKIYNNVVKDFGNKPLWMTETGFCYKYNEMSCKDGGEQNQSKFYNLLINEALTEDSNIRKVFFFASHIPGEEDVWSMFDITQDYSYNGKVMHRPRPAAQTYKRIIAGNYIPTQQIDPEIIRKRPTLIKKIKNFFFRAR